MSAQPRWDTPNPLPPGRSAGERGDGGAGSERRRIVSVIALASIAAGAINIAAAATIARGSAQNLAFFWVVGVAQLVWGRGHPGLGSPLVARARRVGQRGRRGHVGRLQDGGASLRPVRPRRAARRVPRHPGHDPRGGDRRRCGGAGRSRIGSGSVRGSCARLRARGRGVDRRARVSPACCRRPTRSRPAAAEAAVRTARPRPTVGAAAGWQQ